jgi:hypothetical protein
VFFLADDMNAKFYLRSSDANDNTDYGAFLYLYDPTGNKFLDSEPLIDGKTIVEALRIISAILAGKVTGAGTGSEVFRSLDDTSNRVSVTVDAEGNRTAVTY